MVKLQDINGIVTFELDDTNDANLPGHKILLRSILRNKDFPNAIYIGHPDLHYKKDEERRG